MHDEGGAVAKLLDGEGGAEAGPPARRGCAMRMHNGGSRGTSWTTWEVQRLLNGEGGARPELMDRLTKVGESQKSGPPACDRRKANKKE